MREKSTQRATTSSPTPRAPPHLNLLAEHPALQFATPPNSPPPHRFRGCGWHSSWGVRGATLILSPFSTSCMLDGPMKDGLMVTLAAMGGRAPIDFCAPWDFCGDHELIETVLPPCIHCTETGSGPATKSNLGRRGVGRVQRISSTRASALES